MAEHHRLFFALWPDDAVRQRIADATHALEVQRRPQGRRSDPARYHLTLQFLGDHAVLPVETVARAAAAAAHVDVRAFALTLDRAGSFAGPRLPWWLGCEPQAPALLQLWNGLGAALRAAGVTYENERTFVPHVTVLRTASVPLPPVAIEPIEWTVRGFVLVDSRAGEGGGYDVLQEWTLRA